MVSGKYKATDNVRVRDCVRNGSEFKKKNRKTGRGSGLNKGSQRLASDDEVPGGRFAVRTLDWGRQKPKKNKTTCVEFASCNQVEI